MNTLLHNIATAIAATLLVSACQGGYNQASEENLVKEKGNVQAQWPMFSGPNTNGQVVNELTSPTVWSARQNNNIMWRTELPAGGQSGIVVWKDNVFFTINKPLDTPKYEQLLASFNRAKSDYETLFQKAISVNNDNVLFQEKQEAVLQTLQTWEAHVEQFSQTTLTKTAKINHHRVIKKMKRNSPLWHSLQTAEKSRNDFLHQQSKEILTSYQHYQKLQKQLNTKGVGKDVILFCLSAYDGTVKWQRTISGMVDTMYNYAFSDATSPTPVTDGKKVWVINAAGGMTSFNLAGEKIWSRNWQPTTGRPFNKQYDTLLHNDYLFNVEPPVEGDITRNPEWNYIHAFDKNTGKRQWVSTEALTHYNTPMLGKTADGVTALLIGRGGPHGVPEREEGLSLLNIDNGQALWNWQTEQDQLLPWGATDIQLWNEKVALWFAGNKDLTLYAIDSQTGKTKKTYDLSSVSRFIFDEKTQKHQLTAQKKTAFERQPYTPVLVGDALYYLVRYEPYIGYLNLKTGQHLQLEIPTEVERGQGQKDQFIWKEMQTTDQLNSQGQRHNIEQRSQGDGTQKAFLASPIVINNNIYFTNAHGLTYVIDSKKPFGKNSLIAVNDIGEKGKTYSLSSLAYANNTIFQRSLKAIYAIQNQ